MITTMNTDDKKLYSLRVRQALEQCYFPDMQRISEEIARRKWERSQYQQHNTSATSFNRRPLL